MKKRNLIVVALLTALINTGAQAQDSSSIPAENTAQDNSWLARQDFPVINLVDEKYVNDIPFNTEMIANKALLAEMVKKDEEPEVNDIPFDTERICQDILLNDYVAEWKDEAYEDDIPFDTRFMKCCRCAMKGIMPACVDLAYVEKVCFYSQGLEPIIGMTLSLHHARDGLAGYSGNLAGTKYGAGRFGMLSGSKSYFVVNTEKIRVLRAEWDVPLY